MNQSHSSTAVLNNNLDEEKEEDDIPLQQNYTPEYQLPREVDSQEEEEEDQVN
jgi:hypothetical protein